MELLRAILVNFVVPLAELGIFLRLREQMRDQQIERPPTVPLFIILATYGGLLMVVLTALFWRWSGMASLCVSRRRVNSSWAFTHYTNLVSLDKKKLIR